MRYPCNKRPVYAVLVLKNKKIFVGENSRLQTFECPRELANLPAGVGYKLCEKICYQRYHAEIDALTKAKRENKSGSKMYIFGHWRSCPDCIQTMKSKGIEKIVFHEEKE